MAHAAKPGMAHGCGLRRAAARVFASMRGGPRPGATAYVGSRVGSPRVLARTSTLAIARSPQRKAIERTQQQCAVTSIPIRSLGTCPEAQPRHAAIAW